MAQKLSLKHAPLPVVTFIAGVIIGTLISGNSSPRLSSFIPSKPTSTVAKSVPQQTDDTAKRTIDGDTFETLDGKRVRLIGIDTPELAGKDCYAQEAKARLAELIEGKMIILEKDVSETDRFNRLLRYVYVLDNDGNMQSVNEILISEGYAHAVTFPPDVRNAEKYLQLEKQAREGNRGGWKACKSFK